MHEMARTAMLMIWLTPVHYDYSWNWGQQHALLNIDKQVRYSVTVYPQGQRVFEVQHKGQTVFQGVTE